MRTTSDIVNEIRDGYMTREKGIGLVRKYDEGFLKKYFKKVLDYRDKIEDHFWGVTNEWRSNHFWENCEGKWMLKHPVG